MSSTLTDGRCPRCAGMVRCEPGAVTCRCGQYWPVFVPQEQRLLQLSIDNQLFPSSVEATMLAGDTWRCPKCGRLWLDRPARCECVTYRPSRPAAQPALTARSGALSAPPRGR